MLLVGKNLTLPNDQLQRAGVQQVYNAIKNPNHELKSRIDQLRIILSIDTARYRSLKTTLPYFTCGIFNPPYRKTEYFGYIEHFVLDYDNLKDSNISAEKLKEILTSDERVEMLFTSPSGNGIKVMFRLSERCYDRVHFTMFYKIFVRAFSAQYGIEMAADSSTSDVTRACFLSSDPAAFYNVSAVPVKQDAYIDFNSPEQITEANQLLKEKRETVIKDEKEPQGQEIDPDIFEAIKKKLKPDIRMKRDKIIYVPDELEVIIRMVTEKLGEYGISVKSVQNIHYGKKFVLGLGLTWAEVNVFYGKRGFSVVKTPKRGSNEELADISQRIICELLF